MNAKQVWTGLLLESSSDTCLLETLSNTRSTVEHGEHGKGVVVQNW